MLGELCRHRVGERPDGGLPCLSVGVHAVIRIEHRVRLADGHREAEPVARRREGGRGDAVVREPCIHCRRGLRAWRYERRGLHRRYELYHRAGPKDPRLCVGKPESHPDRNRPFGGLMPVAIRTKTARRATEASVNIRTYVVLIAQSLSNIQTQEPPWDPLRRSGRAMGDQGPETQPPRGVPSVEP